jgi:membrane dipeptidase
MATAVLAGAGLLANAESTYDHAVRLMKTSPLLDTHVDLPQILRSLGRHMPLVLVKMILHET